MPGGAFAGLAVMSDVLSFPHPGQRSGLALIDALDAAQSELDNAEQLFCAGHPDAAQRCIDTAVRILGGAE